MEHLKHVTGLRAYAVIAVLLFHLGVPGLDGGFVGVDAFFVISGFLITGILVREVDQSGAIDLLRFFTRRIRRLLPALMVTLAVTFICSAVILAPEHLKPAAESTIAAALSVSNILFWHEAGYFDVLEGSKPLLHTWSLSVEMQFYLFWPLLILFVARFARNLLLPTIVVAGLISFMANYTVEGDALFFLTPFRVFEFSFGAVLVWTAKLKFSRLVDNGGVVVGMMLLILPVFVLTGAEPFPRHYALMPCFGAALLIQFGASRLGALLLSNQLSVGLGEISYSLYLVHWPIIVIYRYWTIGGDFSRTEMALLGGCSLVLALVLYFVVERPFRERATHKPKTLWAMTFGAVVALSAPALGAAYDGWAGRSGNVFPPDVRNRERLLDDSTAGYCRIEVGLVGDCDMSKPHKILMVGDSHLRAMTYAFGAALPDTQIINLSYRGCHDVLAVVDGMVISDAEEDFCRQKADFLNSGDPIFSQVDAVVLASYRPFSYHANTFRFDLFDLILSKTNGLTGIVLGNYFQTDQSKPCSTIVQRRQSLSACMDEFANYVGSATQVATEPLFAEHAEKYHFVDIASLFCPTLKNCPGEYNGAPFLFDADHLTPSFARYMIETIVHDNRPYLMEIGLL